MHLLSGKKGCKSYKKFFCTDNRYIYKCCGFDCFVSSSKAICGSVTLRANLISAAGLRRLLCLFLRYVRAENACSQACVVAKGSNMSTVLPKRCGNSEVVPIQNDTKY